MSPVVWSPTALVDLDRLYQFLKPQNPEAAKQALQAIVQAAKSLSQNPRKGTVLQEAVGLRKLLVRFGRYGYVIHYSLVADEVIVLRVYHGRQNRPS